MKIAVFHNFMDNIGGAEMVGLTLAREFDADFYTTNIDKDKISKMGFENVNLVSIGSVPVNAPFRQQAALRRFRHLDLRKKYDFYLIDGDWAMSGAVNNRPNLWYVHSPIREIWDLYRYTRQHTVPWYGKYMFDAWVRYNRFLNRRYVASVNHIVCNSKNTQQRVKRYLKRDAVVINPPIDTSLFRYGRNGDFWLSVNRLITHKRVDMQIRAFSKMPGERLVIVGSYEQSRHFRAYSDYIKSIKPHNVEILSWVSREKLIQLYAECKGFITTSKDEDFGMAPVEAMASGKPVIAPNEGGYKETVLQGTTGVLIDEINEDKLVEAIRQIGTSPQRYKDACLRRSQAFDTKKFVSKISEIIGR